MRFLLLTVTVLAAATLACPSAQRARVADPICVGVGPYSVDGQEVLTYTQECLPTA